MNWRNMTLVLLIAMTVSMALTRLGAALLQPTDPVTRVAFLESDASRKPLVVIIHGLEGSAAAVADVTHATRHLYPDADILVPDYVSTVFANGDPDLLSARINVTIEQYFDPDRHQRVIIIGNSMGALISRKAYLMALNAHSRDNFNLRADRWVWPCNSFNRENWACSTDRFVLLAGLNAGWDRENIRLRIAARVGEIWGVGTFIRRLEKGSPFVSDLRVDWLSLGNAAYRQQGTDGSAFQMPDMIMLQGDDDWLVSPDDNMDLNASGRDFAFIDVASTTHDGIKDFGLCSGSAAAGSSKETGTACSDPRDIEDPTARHRFRKFREAMILPVEVLERKYPNALRSGLAQDDTVTHVVYLVHGIRSFGEWATDFEERFDAADEPGLIVKGVRYKRFPMLSFLLFNSRDANVRQFVDEYTADLARYPNLERVSFVGNSNGTYILARTLEKYHAPRFSNVYFSGSVVRYEFPWVRYLDAGRVQMVRNDAAASDWVVAWFPGFYQQIASTGWVSADGFFNLGTGGFNGFADRDTRIVEVEFVPGGHGSPLHAPGNAETIVDFIMNGSTAGPVMTLADKPNGLIQTGANLAWLIMIALVGIVFALGLAVRAAARKISGPVTANIATVLYGLVLIIFLNTY